MNSEHIFVYSFDRFETKLAALNKKAVRTGLRPVEVGEVVRETKFVKNSLLENVEVFSHYDVELLFEDEVIRFPGGWSLVGVIDHTEKLVKSVPGAVEHPLTPYVERGAVCDHCHTYRDRNETFVVVNEAGEFFQVGRSCLGDLLGISPERALGQVEVVKELGDEEEWLGERQVDGYALSFFLAHAACMIRTAGWRSRSNADFGSPATADLTWSNIIDQRTQQKDRRSGEPLWIDPNEADKATGKVVGEWLEQLAERDGLNDYLSNLAQIGRNQFVSQKSAGYAASAINAYLKEQEIEVKRAARREQSKGSQHVGKKGDRITLQVNKVSSAGFDTQWGYTFYHRFIDSNGNVIVWKTGNELDNGLYTLTGTVKSHDDYKGEAQTQLTRCKVGLSERDKVAA